MLFTGWDCWGRGDWDQFSFRFETPRTAMVRDGELPLWNPYVNGGTVLAAHPHCPAFSPWYVLTLVLGAPTALRVGVVLFMALGSTGMAALLRRWGVGPVGCFAGGVLLMMSPHFVMHIAEGHLEWCVLGLMPWVMWCLDRVKEGWRFAVHGALLLASALLYGSIYIVVVFVPLLCLWAVLESLRTRSWRTVIGGAASVGLTLLLCAVSLLPRVEFLRANPRKTEASERLAPAALRRAMLDPDQAALFRATRDVRNPRDDELARILPSVAGSDRSPEANRPYETLKWHRLELTLTTTSEWADVGLGEFPHLWFFDGPEAPDKTPARLNSLPPPPKDDIGEGLRVWGAKRGGEEVTGRATLYVQLPERGHLKLSVNQGVFGSTKLTVKCNGQVVLDVVNGGVAWRGSSRLCYIRRGAILRADATERHADAPWRRFDAMLTTSSQWCRVEVVGGPYLFRVESPRQEVDNEKAGLPVPVATGALDVKGHRPGQIESKLRAALYVRMPPGEDLHVAVTQGPGGTSEFSLCSPQGEPLGATRREATQPGGCKTFDYVFSGKAVSENVTPQSEPEFRWWLDERGMTYNWQEYGCYVTWLGLGAAMVGLVVALRRRWPAVVVGAVAGLVAMGAALPVNVWALWRLLPMYGSLQVPSRFLAVVVFATAVCAGFGIDRVGRWSAKLGGAWTGRLIAGGMVAAVYLELAVLGWSLFSEIFVCPKRPVPSGAPREFAQRFANDDARYAAMYSAHYPYLKANSGVLRHYENIAVARGKVRLATDPEYRGEAYLEGSPGRAEIVRWSMSRVRVAVQPTAAGRLVLNQNYFNGWKAARRDADGKVERLPAVPSPDGLVSIGVRAGDREVEFYYLPTSFLIGACVSCLTLLGCLGFLAVGMARNRRSWRLKRLVATVVRRSGPVIHHKAFGYVTFALVVNVPFLVCHPGWTWIDIGLIRSLAINAVLFLLPGLPLVGAMVGRGWLARGGLLWVMAASLLVLVALVLSGLPVQSSVFWNATWIITNLALLLNLFAGGPPACGVCFRADYWRLGVPLFLVAYVAFHGGATRVVPPMFDHDLDIQGPGYALLTRGVPEVVNDRWLMHYFAHPLLLNCYEAASFLYFDDLDYLKRFDDATERVRRLEAGDNVAPAVTEFCRLGNGTMTRDRGEDEPGTTRHRIVGVRGADYVVEPPMPEEGDRISIREFEVQLLYDDYRRDPRRLQTRTPNIFLAAITVAWLGIWIGRCGKIWWLGLLIAAAYATNPEVFVRSSYGGYFAISMFALVQMLAAAERVASQPGREAWFHGLLAGTFAALANNKLVLLPVALVIWQCVRVERAGTLRRLVRAVTQPVVLGFLAGTIAFWVYGLAINVEEFWADHVRIHAYDRLIQYNPLDYQGYPTVLGLWRELWEHTGYVLMPLGVVALGMLCGTDRTTVGWRGTPGLWGVWMLVTAVTFSLIDWRQTKHLMPLLLPLHLAPACWVGACGEASRRTVLLVVSVLFAGLLIWNLDTLAMVADNFSRIEKHEFAPFRITPAW